MDRAGADDRAARETGNSGVAGVTPSVGEYGAWSEAAAPGDPRTRAAELVHALGLAPHPEGGFFRRLYRSDARVTPADGRQERAAVTTIYYLLEAGRVSRWHRVASDEVWHHYEGAPLELHTVGPAFANVERRTLGPLAGGAEPVLVVPAGTWQAARTTGAYTLVGCTVAPGFEFKDFELLRDSPALAAELARRHPALAAFV